LSISTNKLEGEEKTVNPFKPSSASRMDPPKPAKADQMKGEFMLHRRANLIISSQGFSLIESMIALFILTFGLLATGQILFTAAGLGQLARSKNTAGIAAQSTLEFLSDLYQRNPAAEELAPGSHGPIQTEVMNPVNDRVLNRYSISWRSELIPDSNPIRSPQGRIISVRATPILSAENEIASSIWSKTLTVSALISPDAP
jgi:prepilin-type N-terminal cleavage/methylation domain-containing protein